MVFSELWHFTKRFYHLIFQEFDIIRMWMYSNVWFSFILGGFSIHKLLKAFYKLNVLDLNLLIGSGNSCETQNLIFCQIEIDERWNFLLPKGLKGTMQKIQS